MAIRFDFIGKMALIMLIAFAAPLQTNILAQGTAVTVVSDTTDDDEGNAFNEESDTVAANSNVIMIDEDMEPPSWWKFFIGDGSVWDLAHSLFTDSPMLLLPLIILFAIILLPALLIILFIIFLMRDRRRSRQRPYYAQQNTSYTNDSTYRERNLEKEKDRVVINLAIALGICIFCIAYSWRFGTLLSVIYLCVQAGRFINLRRAEKRNNNNNTF